MRDFLIFFPAGEVARRIPHLRVGVDGRILVDISCRVCDDRVGWYDLHAIACGNRTTTDILAKGGAKKIEPDRIFEAQVDNRELRLPCLKWNIVQLIAQGLRAVSRVSGSNSTDFVTAFSHPIRRGREIAQDPR